MSYAYQGEGALNYFPCQYGISKLLLRGPKRPLDQPYIAVLGGTETYGKFVPRPYPALLEQAAGLPVVNLGFVNAGPDVYVNDPTMLDIAAGARVTVVQMVGAQNLTNRYYSVHPRRNDRFLRASPLLKSLFGSVDFTEFHFTRHMLHTLHAVSPAKFEVVAEELRAAWVTRMTGLLGLLHGKTVLMWLSGHAPQAPDRFPNLTHDPILVDAEMVAAVRPHASSYLEVVSSPTARACGLDGMAFGPLDEPAALGLPGPAVHAEVAQALSDAVLALW